MSANLELIKLAYGHPEIFFENARNGALNLESFYSERAILDVSEFDAPGLGGIHHGYSEIGDFWQGWTSSWDPLTWTAEGFEREPFVVADILLQGTGKASGITVELPHSQLFWLVNGKVELHRMYLDRRDGFEAARIPLPS